MNEKRKASTAYLAKLRDPRWQRKRLEILTRDEWMCQRCQDTESTLVIHHRFYERGMEPWEAPDFALITLCQACHEHEHDAYPQYAADLIGAIKAKGFFSDDASLLVDAFAGLQIINAPEYMASLLKFALTDPETMDLVYERFVEYTRRRVAAMKETRAAAEGANGQTA